MTNILLKRAVHTRPVITKRGRQERLFTLLFGGLVYNQVWEDPEVDLAALALKPRHRLVAIASAGCNILNYLAANPASVIGIDLNPNHLALAKLKLSALKNLPDYEHFFRFFGGANDKLNCNAYDEFLRARLDDETRRYWDGRTLWNGRRIAMFARQFYKYGLVGRFLGIVHAFARLRGKRLESIVEARTLAEQRAAFEQALAPLCDHALVRRLTGTQLFMYALGIPPSQYDELLAASKGNLHALLRGRVEKLACDFPIADNYFAWQVFARAYDIQRCRALPPYLRRDTYAVIKRRADRVKLHYASMTDFLKQQPPNSINRFVLLDAQDWMTGETVVALWEQINRVADALDARVIFRTAGHNSPLRALPYRLLAPWQYLQEESMALHKKDRASIYGGFHLYIRNTYGRETM